VSVRLLYKCMYFHIYICVYVYTHICIYLYIYIYTWQSADHFNALEVMRVAQGAAWALAPPRRCADPYILRPLSGRRSEVSVWVEDHHAGSLSASRKCLLVDCDSYFPPSLYIYIYIYIYIYVYIYMCVYVCMYIYICIYIYTHNTCVCGYP